MSDAQDARDDAIDRVEKGADPEFIENALEFVYATALRHKEFTTDNVVAMMSNVPAPREPRVWGAIMMKARKAGWIIPGTYAPSSSRRSHARPKRIWISQFID